MSKRVLIISAIFILMTFLSGCGDSPAPANKNTNGNSAPNANAPAPNTNNPLETTKKPEVPTTNEAPTLAPVFKAYCEAILKKDEAALRRVYSAETLKVLEKDSKAENKSLVEFLSELDEVKNPAQCVGRNEKIEGDKGVAELRSETMPSWIPVEFVKENGEWKLTNKSPDLVK